MTVIFWVGLLVSLGIGFDMEGEDGMLLAAALYILGFHVYRLNRKVAYLEKKIFQFEIPFKKNKTVEQAAAHSSDVNCEKEHSRDGFLSDPRGRSASSPDHSDGPPPLPEDWPEETEIFSAKSNVYIGEKGQKTVEAAEPLRRVRAASSLEQRIMRFMTTGNVVVKIGWVILFFGVGFLLKFASDRNMFPVEVRYIAVAAAASALLWFGWVLRGKNKAYALLLQGGAIGLLYMTAFSAAKLHRLIPLEFAFVVLVCLVVFSGMLSVVQDARFTAFFGAAGGFLAPVLTSTGEGSHVMLFSYYALLNCGILGIAWFKSWRELNLMGFVFTFGIGGLWGLKAYRPEHFMTTEPFLILFFFFFSIISVLFAVKQPEDRKGYVDGSLVFGLPVISFTLQSYLVKNMGYGLAVSAVTLSFYYLILARLLWGQKNEGLRTLIESFLALGVVFASLALPLSLDGRWTAAAWAMEGGALVWVGVRQNRLKARLFGYLLQIGAGISFVMVMGSPARHIPVLNGFYLGCLSVSLSGFFSSYVLHMNPGRLRSWERNFHGMLLVWGLLWWCGAAVSEIQRHVIPPYQMSAYIFFSGFTVGILMYLYGKLKWLTLKYPLFCLSTVLAWILVNEYAWRSMVQVHPFKYFGWAAWLYALGVFYRSLYLYESDLEGLWCDLQHLSGYLLVLCLLCMESAHLMTLVKGIGGVWSVTVWGIVPLVVIMLILFKGKTLAWPLTKHESKYKGDYQLPVMACLLLWFLITGFTEAGTPIPLPYIPVINPLESTQLLYILTAMHWLRIRGNQDPGVSPVYIYYGRVFAALAGFLWMNTVIGRSVHVFTAIPFDWAIIWRSTVFQASVSVIWTCLALMCMVFARNNFSRVLWFTGASLLGMVVLKLFAVDLSNSRAIARIVSFLATGVLMLVIGFFSPLPPRKEKDQS